MYGASARPTRSMVPTEVFAPKARETTAIWMSSSGEGVRRSQRESHLEGELRGDQGEITWMSSSSVASRSSVSVRHHSKRKYSEGSGEAAISDLTCCAVT